MSEGDERPTILVVEDDAGTAAVLVRGLRAAGFGVELAINGALAVTCILQRPPALVLLDLMLPERSGFEVLERVQHLFTRPILVLTARVALEDRLRAFSLGARDFVTKPFWLEEIVARIRSHLGAPPDAPRRQLVFGAITLDLDARSLHLDSVLVSLTPSELAVLAYLAARPGRAISRRILAEQAFADVAERDDRGVDPHVARLRRKLGAYADTITTVWGIGYRFDPPGTPT